MCIAGLAFVLRFNFGLSQIVDQVESNLLDGFSEGDPDVL
jgi:hypothetical protein